MLLSHLLVAVVTTVSTLVWLELSKHVVVVVMTVSCLRGCQGRRRVVLWRMGDHFLIRVLPLAIGYYFDSLLLTRSGQSSRGRLSQPLHLVSASSLFHVLISQISPPFSPCLLYFAVSLGHSLIQLVNVVSFWLLSWSEMDSMGRLHFLDDCLSCGRHVVVRQRGTGLCVFGRIHESVRVLERIALRGDVVHGTRTGLMGHRTHPSQVPTLVLAPR